MACRTKTQQPTPMAKAAPHSKARPTKTRVEKGERTAAAPDAAMSKAVSKTWKNAAVRKARTTRSGCRIGKEHYTSVREAFVANKLPLGIHQRIRRIVKTEGKAEVNGVVIVLVKE